MSILNFFRQIINRYQMRSKNANVKTITFTTEQLNHLWHLSGQISNDANVEIGTATDTDGQPHVIFACGNASLKMIDEGIYRFSLRDENDNPTSSFITSDEEELISKATSILIEEAKRTGYEIYDVVFPDDED